MGATKLFNAGGHTHRQRDGWTDKAVTYTTYCYFSTYSLPPTKLTITGVALCYKPFGDR